MLECEKRPPRQSIVVLSSEGPGCLYGGVGRHVHEILPRLAERQAVHLLCIPSYGLRDLPDERHLSHDAATGTTVVRDPALIESLQRTPFLLDRYRAAADAIVAAVFKHLPRRVDALLLEDYYGIALAHRLIEELSIRHFVVFAHLPLTGRFSYFDKGVDEERQQLLEAAAMLSADKVLVPSESARRTASGVYAIARERIDVVPLGTETTAPETADLRRPQRIVTVARFTEQKGWHSYLSIVEKVERSGRTPVWSLVGDGPLRGTVLERLCAMVPDERIEWHARLEPRTALPALLSRSMMFFLPSAHETFGLAALEAAGHGAVPVLAAVGALQEVWGAAAAMFAPGDLDAGAAIIVDLLDDPDKCAAAALAARQQAGRYSWDRHVALLERLCLAG